MKRLIVLQNKTPVLTPDESYEVFVSHNSKTGYSVNVAIANTCRPTKACAEYCYALIGRLTFPSALAAQARNATFFATSDETTLKVEARRVGRHVLRKQSFVRMFGVGDLQPGSVTFTAALAERTPELQVWVSTRKLELAAQLPVLPNLHVMLSCDSTTTENNIQETRRLIRERKPMFFAAWVRQGPKDKPPAWVSVVFEEHHLSGRAKWTPDKRACPATVKDGAEHEGACAKCRFCFSSERRTEGLPYGP